MTATDELRRLLDERGIEYEPIDSVHSPNRRTLWGEAERSKGVFGMCFKYETIEFKKGMRLTISDCSPAQAVEATLGSDHKAENEKLRELCGELYHELYAARDEHWPASYLGDLEPRDVFPRYDELIELGVDI